MKNGMFTQDHAQAVFDDLCVAGYSVSLSFTFHEKMVPAETYQVHVRVGPGSFPADRLRGVLEIVERHGCAAHLIGSELLILQERS